MISEQSRWGYGIFDQRVHGVACKQHPPCFHCDVHGGNIPRSRVDTDKRSAVESGEKKIHLACTVCMSMTRPLTVKYSWVTVT